MVSGSNAPPGVVTALVESSNDAIVSRDMTGRIAFWNAAAERLFGWRAEEVLGRDISLMHPDEVRGEIARGRRRFARGEELGETETVRLRTVAEGVETAVQQAQLARLGCDEGQGYLYSPALPAAQFGALLASPPRTIGAARRRAAPRPRRGRSRSR